MSGEFPVRELLRPEAFRHRVGEIALHETHISWVVLTGSFAYKIKKAVKYDFIDTRSLEVRRKLCEEELRLNQRYAPQLYLDVVAITRAAGGLVVGADGPAVEYAVRMRQFDAKEELPALLECRDVTPAQAEDLGDLLANFHLQAAVAPPSEAPARTQQMYRTVFGNLAQLVAHSRGEHPWGLNRLIDWMNDTAQALESVFEERERGGFVRECHGDLHAANIVRLQGRLVPFDCIEFDPRLRWIDVIDDVAFLVMDLTNRGRADLAWSLLSNYLATTGDYEGTRVLPFYAVHRALVRAKVDALSVEHVPAQAAEFQQRLRKRVDAAIGWATPRQPMLILMHGASGTGKSWLSRQLVGELCAIRIRSDLERKRLAGLKPTQSATADVGAGIYSSEFSRRTYAWLADRVEHCLRAGFNVIVDAAFLDASDRDLFRALAARLGVRRVIISCQVDAATAAARIRERAAKAGDPSDATVEVLESQLRQLEPFAPAEQPDVLTVDTREPGAVEQIVARIHGRTVH